MSALFVNENVELAKDLTHWWSVRREQSMKTVLPAGYRGVVVEDERRLIAPADGLSEVEKAVIQSVYRVHFITPEGRHVWAFFRRDELRSVEAVPA
jgi:hypothetical protein